jgi:NADPH-dependent curcumin reductase CurA
MNRQIHLASRPDGEPAPENFALVETELPVPAVGEVLIRNAVMSVDPYMRGRMNDVKSYVPPFQIGEPLEGGAVGEVVESNDPTAKPGTFVLHQLGWREYAVVPGDRVTAVDPALPLSSYLGVLGMPGMTAWAGLFEVAGYRDGETVYVSAAAGAVGSLAGQLAKLRGSRVIGSAGSTEKVDWLTGELGFDAAFNYRETSVGRALRELAPDGIDVYFDNVGGSHLEAAIFNMRTRGRIALCGAIEQYNDAASAPGPRNLSIAIGRRLTLRGYIVTDYWNRYPDFLAEVGPLVRDGTVRYRETVVEGIERAPEAFIGLLRGDNIGKMVVRLAES